MSRIKRYKAEHFGDFEMVEDSLGEWVKWESVKKLLLWILSAEDALTFDEIIEGPKDEWD